MVKPSNQISTAQGGVADYYPMPQPQQHQPAVQQQHPVVPAQASQMPLASSSNQQISTKLNDTLKISERFNLKQKLGQGTFSFIYQAYDQVLKKDVALKVEKKDKNKSILVFEYNVLVSLKGLKHVCNVYDFVKNSE